MLREIITPKNDEYILHIPKEYINTKVEILVLPFSSSKEDEEIKFKHTQMIKSINITNEKLAQEIGDLYYDSLNEFLLQLSLKLEKDANSDLKRERKKLSKELFEASDWIKKASKNIDNAWDISSPYVENWTSKYGTNREKKG